MKTKRLVIAIDGPTASGKSTAGRALAARLGYLYIDSGAMYRAVALAALRDEVDLGDEEALTGLARRVRIELAGDPARQTVTLDGDDVTEAIRTPDVDAASSRVSTVPGIREAMVDQQRRLGADGGVVMDGRDIGTKVFPEADVKFFLCATPEVRARRRWAENEARGVHQSLDATEQALAERDARDTTRATAPLVAAADAIEIDTTRMSREELLDHLLEIVHSRD
jgi:cytidylate kinase